MYKFLLIAIVTLASCTTTKYYIVRHAEKDSNTMTSDVPLSETGRQRAEALRDMLKNKKIGTIYSTDYMRTKSTAQPLADEIGTTMQLYNPRDTSFATRIANMGKTDHEGNVLIVGHSNTVDDLVNDLMGRKMIPADLPESQYGDLFIVTKKGKKFILEKKKFGE